MKIKVLWIDDQPYDSYDNTLDYAWTKGIDIKLCLNVEDGIKELLTKPNIYDAIILDANCVAHNIGNKESDVKALSYALKEINTKGIKQPWFVYSGGDFEGVKSITDIVGGQERPYDDKDWYNKLTDTEALFDKIVNVVSNSDIYRIKDKYADILGILPNWDNQLVSILLSAEACDSCDIGVMNCIRQTSEQLTMFLYSKGLSPVQFPDTSLNECSKMLCSSEFNTHIPSYVQESMRFIVRISNPIAHSNNEDEIDSNQISKDFQNNQIPYLIRSIVYSLLNILYWCKQFTNDSVSDIEFRRVRVNESYQIYQLRNNNISNEGKTLEYEGKTFIVKEDVLGNLHCGECLISYSLKNYIGQQVKLSNVIANTKTRTKGTYPLFANNVDTEGFS